MQQELIEMLDKIVEYVAICNEHDQRFSSSSYGVDILKEAKKLVEKAKNSAKEPAVPRGFATLNEWFLSLPEQRQAQLRDDKWMLANAAFMANRTAAPSQPAVPEIDYEALIHAAFAKNAKWAQGTAGCIAFSRGAEWFRAQMLAATPSQEPSTEDLSEQLNVALSQVRYLLKDQAEKAAIIAARQKPVTLTDSYAGVIAWIGDKQCKRVLTEGAIKHEHTPGVAMRNTAHQCVQEVIIAALREKEGK